MKKIFLVLVLLLVFGSWAFPQGMKTAEIKGLIDSPTAGSLKRAQYDFEVRLFPGGGALAGFSIGLFDRLMMGIFYGGESIIADSAINWNAQPGVIFKYRLFEETMKFPALSIGYSSQGYGAYNDSTKRYAIKAKGFFVVAGRNFKVDGLGFLGMHGGINYNPQEKMTGGDRPDLYVGLDKSINEEISVVAEYDFAWNDLKDSSFKINTTGYLNAGLRWTFASRISIELDFKNILKKNEAPGVSREIKINYLESF